MVWVCMVDLRGVGRLTDAVLVDHVLSFGFGGRHGGGRGAGEGAEEAGEYGCDGGQLGGRSGGKVEEEGGGRGRIEGEMMAGV